MSERIQSIAHLEQYQTGDPLHDMLQLARGHAYQQAKDDDPRVHEDHIVIHELTLVGDEQPFTIKYRATTTLGDEETEE